MLHSPQSFVFYGNYQIKEVQSRNILCALIIVCVKEKHLIMLKLKKKNAWIVLLFTNLSLGVMLLSIQ